MGVVGGSGPRSANEGEGRNASGWDVDGGRRALSGIAVAMAGLSVGRWSYSWPVLRVDQEGFSACWHEHQGASYLDRWTNRVEVYAAFIFR
jgi:hypothetical protein